MNAPSGNRGALTLGDYSVLSGIVLADTKITPTGGHIAISHCDLARCDLRDLWWEMLNLCKMTDCFLPGDAPAAAVGPMGLRATFEHQGLVMWSTPEAQEEAAHWLLGPKGECEHDWRQDPHAPTKTSYPPQYRTVCAKCKAERWVTAKVPSQDPADWPKIASR